MSNQSLLDSFGLSHKVTLRRVISQKPCSPSNRCFLSHTAHIFTTSSSFYASFEAALSLADMSKKYIMHYPDATDPDNKLGKFLIGHTNNKEVVDEIPNICAKLGDQRWRYCTNPNPNSSSEEEINADGGLTYHKNKVKVDYRKDIRRRRKLEFRKCGRGILNNNEGNDDEVWTTNNCESPLQSSESIHFADNQHSIRCLGTQYGKSPRNPSEGGGRRSSAKGLLLE